MTKKLLYLSVFLFLFISCGDEKELSVLDQVLLEYRITPQVFQVATDSIMQVTGKKGTTLKINPDNIDFPDGKIPTNIRIELIELTTTEELLRHNVQTVSNGKWLISGGSFKISMFDGEKPLSLKNGKTISAVFPKIRNENMQLFYGERGEQGEMNWEPENQFFEEELYLGILETHNITMDTVRRSSKFRGYFIEDTFFDSLGYSSMVSHMRFFQERGVDSLLVNQDTIKGYLLIAPPEFFDYDLTNDILNDTLQTEFSSLNYSNLLITNFYKPIEINNLGWINIDAFYPEIEDQAKCEITFDTSLDYLKLYLVDRLNNTVINIFPNNNKYIVDLPENIEFDLIVIGSKGKNFFSSMKTVQIQDDEVLELKMEKVNENDLTDLFK
jgi:hypothetical protein